MIHLYKYTFSQQYNTGSQITPPVSLIDHVIHSYSHCVQ